MLPHKFRRIQTFLFRFALGWLLLAPMPRAEASADAPGALDSLKNIRLNDGGTAWVSFGGQLRERFEAWNNFGFGGSGSRDDSFWLTRLRLHSDWRFGSGVRLFAEAKSAFSSDRDLPGGRRASDVDTLDIQNLFAEFSGDRGGEDRWSFSFGRQEIAYGKQRLISPLDWANTRRTFDGLKGELAVGESRLSGFWMLPVEVKKYELNGIGSPQRFFGIYLALPGGGEVTAVDFYALGLHSGKALFNGTDGYEKRYTLGSRAAYGKDALTAEIEGALQFGEIGSADILAFMVALEAGYRFDGAGKPQVYAGFDYAGGDRGSGGNVQTFNQLFPLGHAYLGFIDQVGRQNIIALNAGLGFSPAERVEVKCTLHNFARADTADALYNAGGNVVRAGSLGSSRDVGREIDLTVQYTIRPHWVMLGGVSRFFAGDFIKESGAAQDISFGYASVQFTF